jgi:hypothetical protein
MDVTCCITGKLKKVMLLLNVCKIDNSNDEKSNNDTTSSGAAESNSHVCEVSFC